jgi:ribulose-5-phosphate 4-epimerase/fuculose-1-phosphate aldolase
MDGLDHMIEYIQHKQRLVSANRILAREGVVDAFGHVSIRNFRETNQYTMSRSRSPELVEFEDLMDFTLEGNAIDPRERVPYGERMIHGAIYEARPEINAVVHNHSLAVLPYSLTATALKPAIHVGAVIGEEIPIWDIRDHFGETDMLVRTMEQARNMTVAMGANSCLLMRGHGAVIAGRSLKEAVMIAVYLQVNAQVQTEAMKMGEPTYLSSTEIELLCETQFSPLAMDRAWEYFCVRAGVDVV